MSDYELLYLYRVAKNDWAFQLLFERYQNLIIIITKKVYAKFFSIPLELSDLNSAGYLIFYQVVKEFHAHRQKNFKNYLLMRLKWGLLKYITPYLSPNHQILNMAYQYQELHLKNFIVWFETHFFDYFHLFDLTNLNLSFYERNVLKLKYEGYSNQEIMSLLALNYKQVDNAFQRVILKLRTYFQIDF